MHLNSRRLIAIEQDRFPLSIKASSILGQDSRAVDHVSLADGRSTVAPYWNQATQQVETLAILAGTPAPVQRLARGRKTRGGWDKSGLFPGLSAREVVVGVADPGSSDAHTYAFAIDGQTLRISALDPLGGEWQEASTGPVQGRFSGLRLTGTPSGNLVLYGVDDSGKLFTATQRQTEGPFEVRVHADQAVGDDFRLCMTDDDSWIALVNRGGCLSWLAGRLSGGKKPLEAAPPALAKVVRVVHGMVDVNGTALFLVVTEGDGVSWLAADNRVIPVGLAKNIVTAVSLLDGNNSIIVHALDADNRLWTIRQSTKAPWAQGLPQFNDPVPVDQGVTALAAAPVEAETLFLTRTDKTLHCRVRDLATRTWNSVPVMAAADKATEVTTYRTRIVVKDAKGVAVPDYDLNVQVADGFSAVEIETGGTYLTCGKTPLTLKTDAAGGITFAVLATDISAAQLDVSGRGLDTTRVNPADKVQRYLSGEGSLNSLKPFSADTLANAKDEAGNPLAPDARDAKTAAEVVNAVTNAMLVSRGKTPATLKGFSISFQDNKPVFQAFHTEAELTSHRAGMLADTNGVGGWLDDLRALASDIWDGIKSGAATISKAVVDVANKVVDFTLTIAGQVIRFAKLAVETVENAARFVAGVFQAVKAAAESVVKWLRALFDVKAIWRTKKVFEELLLDLPESLAKPVTRASQAARTGLEGARTTIDRQLKDLAARYADRKPTDFKEWHGTDGGTLVGGVALDDIGGNPHHTWFHDKVAANMPNDVALAASLKRHNLASISDDLDKAWEAVTGSLDNAGDSFRDAVEGLFNAFKHFIEDPGKLGTLVVTGLIDAVRNLVNGVIYLAEAAVAGLEVFLLSMLKALDALFRVELDIPVISTLWKWLAQLGGHPEDKLTFAGLVSLVAAFPVTLVYKLVNGVDSEPFPALTVGTLTGKVFKPNATTRTVAAWLQFFSTIPAALAAILGSESPTLLTVFSIGLSALIFVLDSGLGFDSTTWVEDVELLIFAVGICALGYWAYLRWKSSVERYRLGYATICFAMTAVGIASAVFSLGFKPRGMDKARGAIGALPNIFSILGVRPTPHKTFVRLAGITVGNVLTAKLMSLDADRPAFAAQAADTAALPPASQA